jgi:thioester reductase-like protein
VSTFVTGATGFIGRFLMERLLARGGDVHVLVRAASRDRLHALAQQWGAPDRVHAVAGDLAAPRLGVDGEWVDTHTGRIDHIFHLAAIYDMTAGEQRNRELNVEGTRHAVALANALGAGCFHHVSSVAAAGLYEGVFTEDMYDEGQPLEHPYHATKFDGEGVVRSEATGPWRIYRPAIVVGDSHTGEMDKIDGPYYFFNAIRQGARLPDIVPLIGPQMGDTNMVPVDFVADAIDHIAHQPGLDGLAFHLVSPEPQHTIDVINSFCRAAGAPRITPALPKSTFDFALKVPGVRSTLLPSLGIPSEVADYAGFTCHFDSSRARAALADSDITVPPIDDYAQILWDYWERELSE